MTFCATAQTRDAATQISFTAKSGVPFELTYGLYIDEANLAIIDLLNTAQLSFVLPEGVTIESEAGYHAESPSGAVPEPASLTLVILGLGGLALRRSRTRSI